jgi:hypothetical protein
MQEGKRLDGRERQVGQVGRVGQAEILPDLHHPTYPTYLAHYHLEVELRADLEEPRRNDVLRLPPWIGGRHPGYGHVGEVLLRDRSTVEEIVQIEVDVGLRRAYLEDLRDAEVELVDPIQP